MDIPGKPKRLDLPIAPKVLDGFSTLFDARLQAITSSRKIANAAYPETVCKLLGEISAPVQGGKVASALCGQDESLSKTTAPVFEWVDAQKKAFSPLFDELWKYHSKEEKIDLKSFSETQQTAMQQEREFRFFGQLVPFAARCAQSDKVPVATPSVKAKAAFEEAAEEILQATGTLLRDTYFKRAVSLQELPMFRLLEQSLPGLIETVRKLDVKALYPVRNTDSTSFDRFVYVELSEMLLRCFGHANPRILITLGGLREIDVRVSDEKWISERISEARQMQVNYNSTRSLSDFRYPLRYEEDLIRPLPGWSFWLGDNHTLP